MVSRFIIEIGYRGSPHWAAGPAEAGYSIFKTGCAAAAAASRKARDVACEDLLERTCGTRAAGRELRAQFIIKNNGFSFSGRSLRSARQRRQGAAGLRRAEAAARRSLMRSILLATAQSNPPRSGRGLRSDRTNECEWRAFAGRSCGPLRFLAGTANSAFKINTLIQRCSICFTRAAPQPSDGLARADLRDASCSPPPGGGCGLPVLTDRNDTAGCSVLQAPFRIQSSKFSITHSGRSLRSARQRHQGAAGLRRRRLRPADPYGIDFACGCGRPVLTGRNNTQAANAAQSNSLSSGSSLRRSRTSGRE